MNLDEPLRYFTLGCAVVPFNAKDKKPLVEWQKWQTQKQTKEEFDSLPWKEADGFALIGGLKLNNDFYLGVLDFDVKNLPEDIIEKGRTALKKFPITQMEETPSKGQHWIYYCRTKPRTITAYHNDIALELIGENKLVVMAPSEGYKRLNDNTPTEINDLAELFENTLQNLGLKIKGKENFWFGREDLGQEKYSGRHPPCIEALMKGASEGLRNEFGIRYASYLANFRRLSPRTISKVLAEWNTINKPELDEKELTSLLTSALHGEYVYGCSDPILFQRCNPNKCAICPKNKAKFLKKDERERAEEILNSFDILQYVLKEGRKHLVGEDHVLLTNFIALCSGQTRYPISEIVEGFSGSGKNESLRAIKPLIPEEWIFEFTTSTPEAVKYIPETFSGTLIIYEAAGMRSETSTLGLRAIGEGESIETIYPMRNEATGQMELGKAKTNAKNFVTTESDVDIHPDLYRRVLKTSMNHSDSLTRRVIAKELRQAQYPESLRAFLNINNQNGTLPTDFQNAMRLNEWNREVILFSPFGLMGLMKLGTTKEQKIAVRTHVKKVLHFIRILTLLNQKRRMKIDIGESKFVVANPEDIAKTLNILHTILRSTITRLGKRQDDLLDLFEQQNPLTKHEVAQKLNISESTAYKHLKSLYHNGYLKEEKTKEGAYQYHLLNKPTSLGVLQNPSQYYLFFQSSLKKLLEHLSPLSTQDPPLAQIIDREYAIHLLSIPQMESGEQSNNQESTLISKKEAIQLGLSETPSQDEPVFHHCYFCQDPVYSDDWVSDEFTAHKPAHKECYEKQKAMVKTE